MALLDILRERTARRGGIAQVDCGGLGLLTVEALTPAECGRLANSPRALLYAACRELQAAGEALRKEGKVFRPDEILEYLAEEEAAVAAQAVLSISGMAAEAAAPQEAEPEAAAGADKTAETPAGSSPAMPQKIAEPPLADIPVPQVQAPQVHAPQVPDGGSSPLRYVPAPAEDEGGVKLAPPRGGTNPAAVLSDEIPAPAAAIALQAAGHAATRQAVLSAPTEREEADRPEPFAPRQTPLPRTDTPAALRELRDEVAAQAAETLARELRKAALVR